ncbi:receptor kinase-like protein Xa21 isoform X2 [Lotus japonicus]|uniref:receptor kinase-like protein Xa21 isoform X2 n=1 Tax=Lotus japonicus TaxID=34305 RepID=UPI00258BF0FD|nr:receptor kinase-like protein Xa21 isoform X2 [Lotus japonicus]
MKHFSFLFPMFWYTYLLHLLLFIHLLCFDSNRTSAFALENHTDHLALLKFKESISKDPFGILVSWNSSTHFCHWHGITCSPMHQRVTELNLTGYDLHGSISPHVGNLSSLRNLNLGNNKFLGKIPQELGQLLQLQKLFLTNNSLVGEIPSNLTRCSYLKGLDLYGNNLTGKIPVGIGSLQKLQLLNVGKNSLTGGVPPFLGNLSSLTALSVAYNNLVGDVPKEICRLRKLKIIVLEVNKLSGTFPSCLYNMSSLTVIAAAMNLFNGSLPPNMFHSLLNLQFFAISRNQLSGPIPTSVANASTLTVFDIFLNNFSGQVPSLGKLKDLWFLQLSINNLGDNSTNDLDFLKSLTNCSKLQILNIAGNNFGGSLPNFLGSLSAQLSRLYLGGNHISGKIPSELGNLTNLTLLTMEYNHFEGLIPTTFGKFQKIQVLDLSGNQLSGNIPAFIGNLSHLYYLSLAQNMLGGPIPPTIGNCQKLQSLDLSQNNLKGTIPSEVSSLSSLINLLDLSQNSLSGSLPSEMAKLKYIEKINVSENHLSGGIPASIGDCIRLEYLYLQGNSFHGIIPSSLASLKDLQGVDLSRNRLSGSIPKGLQNIVFLEYFNVSFNNLEGEVPTEGVFGNASAAVVTGNNYLCGGISKLHLPTCPVKGFSARYLIGSGNFGSVYKGTLESEDRVVAIKVLNLEKKGAHKSFIAECNALKNIRHRNLVKIVTCCSSTDHKGQEFKALVFEYLKNGSLEQWLHPVTGSGERPGTLDLDQRLNIIIDVACALHYLHDECGHLVLHCDLKPGNVLLDDDMVAHVSDFGIARIISTINGTSHKQTSTIGVKGTVGYAPPEYGMGSEVSTHGDMYSFGILVLEMLTGRRPTDEMFEDGQNLHKFVEISFPDNLSQILDPSLAPTDVEAAIEDTSVEKCLASLFRIGLACSLESPKERMSIVDVTRELNMIKKAFHDAKNL